VLTGAEVRKVIIERHNSAGLRLDDPPLPVTPAPPGSDPAQQTGPLKSPLPKPAEPADERLKKAAAVGKAAAAAGTAAAQESTGAVGVEYTEGGVLRTARLFSKGGHVPVGAAAAHAGKSVILTAGALHTPKLLMASGVGDGEELARHGLRVRARVPGVGRCVALCSTILWLCCSCSIEQYCVCSQMQ
jgi:choline dehydrogenase-like flavoprotein